MVDPRNFLLNSEYPMDKIILMDSGFIDAEASESGFSTLSKPHNLPFRPQMLWSYSETPDFEASSSNGFMIYGATVQVALTVETDGSLLVVNASNTGSTTKRLYWRAFGFMPSDADLDSEVPATANESSQFYKDSRLNYMKLAKSDVVTASTSGVTVEHNLGFRPRVLVWTRQPNGRERLFQLGVSDPSFNTEDSVIVTDTAVIFTKGSFSNTAQFSYRIYADA